MNSDQKRSHGGDASYSSSAIRDMIVALRRLCAAQPNVQLDLDDLARRLVVPRARVFAREGIGRRLGIVERAVYNIYRVFPPDRIELLDRDECTDINIYLHAFAINVYALFDNIAWVCLLESGQTLSPMKIGLYKPECQLHLPTALRSFLAQPTLLNWFNIYGKLYRDSTAHRIPPYLPPRVLDAAEVEQWRQLEHESHELLVDLARDGQDDQRASWSRYEQLEAERDQLGRNSPLVALSTGVEDAARPVYLHSQLLCDLGLAQELVKTFAAAMRDRYGWAPPPLPASADR